MRPDGSLVGTHWGPISAIGPQPHRRHDNEVWVHTPTPPWGSRRLPQTLEAGGPRRVVYRELLRRSEGVPVTFSDGSAGRVAEVVFPVLGFDFWPETLVVDTTGGKRRVPVSAVARIDTRTPRIEIGGTSEGSRDGADAATAARTAPRRKVRSRIRHRKCPAAAVRRAPVVRALRRDAPRRGRLRATGRRPLQLNHPFPGPVVREDGTSSARRSAR